MREYFTIMLRENSDEGLKLLTQKLNSGFHLDRYIEVGRSTTVILEKYTREEGGAELTPTGLSYIGADVSIPTRNF